MNLICPESRAETGEISKKLGRGKNTTRHTELFETCGGRVVDTPGFSEIEPREFGLVDRTVLPDLFPEFAEPLSEGCRFSDCRHIAEPDCALRRAVEKAEQLAKQYGRPFVERSVSEKVWGKYIKWLDSPKFDLYFALAIFFPVAPDDFLCLLAGLTPMKFRRFVAIILLGKPLALLAYSWGLATALSWLAQFLGR